MEPRPSIISRQNACANPLFATLSGDVTVMPVEKEEGALGSNVGEAEEDDVYDAEFDDMENGQGTEAFRNDDEMYATMDDETVSVEEEETTSHEEETVQDTQHVAVTDVKSLPKKSIIAKACTMWSWFTEALHMGSAKAPPLGPDVFQIFPLPEIQSIRTNQNTFFKCFLAIELVVLVLVMGVVLMIYLTSSQFLAAVVIVDNQIPLSVHTEGCDVQFVKLPRPKYASGEYGTNWTASATNTASPENQTNVHKSDITESISQTTPIGDVFVQWLRNWGIIQRPNDCTFYMTHVDHKRNEYWRNSYCLDWTYNNRHWFEPDKLNEPSQVRVNGIASATQNHPVWNQRKIGRVYTLDAQKKDYKLPGTNFPIQHTLLRKNATVDVVAYERISQIPQHCVVKVWTYFPIRQVTVIGTASSTPTRVTKMEKHTAESQALNKLRPRWRLAIDQLAINGTHMEVELSNMVVTDVNILLERGQVNINGMYIRPRHGALPASNDTNVIETGVDLGARIAVGVHVPANTSSRCATGKTECGGNIRVSLLSPTRVYYSQDEGIVCAAARLVNEEASNCNPPLRGNATNSSSELGNGTSITDGEGPGTCKGQLLLCPSISCVEDDVRSLRLQARKGGVYVAQVEYEGAANDMQNMRSTIDGRRCKFPFKYKNKIFFDCTTEDKGDDAWCKVDELDMSAENSSCIADLNRTTNSTNCSTGHSAGIANDWGFCNPLQTFEGFAYAKKTVQFDAEGVANLKSIKPYENLILNSPVMARLEMKSKTSALGDSMWVYVTRSPYILIRNDFLSIYSGGLVAARSTSKFHIRASPGVCPTEALPDATLSTQAMGKVHDAMKQNINGADTSLLAWFGEYEFDPVLKASGSSNTGVSFSPSDWYEDGLTLYSRLGTGTYVTQGTETLLGSSAARTTIVLTYILCFIYFIMSLILVMPSLMRLLSREYESYIRRRRKLSLTEGQIVLQNQIKFREKEHGISSSDVHDSGKFWNDAEGKPIHFYEEALADLRLKTKKLKDRPAPIFDYYNRGFIMEPVNGRRCLKDLRHGVDAFEAPEGGMVGCDECGECPRAQTLIHGCRECEWDQCEKCYDQHKRERESGVFDFLQEKTIFGKRLGTHDLETLSKKLSPVFFSKNATIIREGEVGDTFYIVRFGECEVSREDVRVSTLRQGEFFGENALMHGKKGIRNATVRAGPKRTIELLSIGKHDFTTKVKEAVSYDDRKRRKQLQSSNKQSWFRRCCTRTPTVAANLNMSELEMLRNTFSGIVKIRRKYRTTLSAHLEFFNKCAAKGWQTKPMKPKHRDEQKKAEREKLELEENHSRTVLAIFPGYRDREKVGKTMSLEEYKFEQLWVDIEECFPEEIEHDSNGLVLNFDAAVKVIELVKTYTQVEDETMKNICECFEICESAWLARQRESANHVIPLNIWEIVDVLYHIFLGPKFKNSIYHFYKDELVCEKKIKEEWFENQSLLVQYGVTFAYFVEKLLGSNRKCLQYEYAPAVKRQPPMKLDDAEDDVVDDGLDEVASAADFSEDDESSMSETEDDFSDEDDDYDDSDFSSYDFSDSSEEEVYRGDPFLPIEGRTCDEDHGLAQFRAPITFICDECDQYTSTMYGCDVCNWDLCQNCYNSNERDKKRKTSLRHTLDERLAKGQLSPDDIDDVLMRIDRELGSEEFKTDINKFWIHKDTGKTEDIKENIKKLIRSIGKGETDITFGYKRVNSVFPPIEGRQCEEKHGLAKSKAPKSKAGSTDTIICNVCNVQVDAGLDVYICNLCPWYECSACYEKNDNIRKLGLLNFLKDVRIFHGLDEEHISMILNFSETEFLVPGHEGNLGGNALYIVRNGECYCDDGFDMKVGDIFGQITIREQDFFSDKVEFKLYDSNRVQAKNAVVELISIGQVFFRRVESLDKRFFNIAKTNIEAQHEEQIVRHSYKSSEDESSEPESSSDIISENGEDNKETADSLTVSMANQPAPVPHEEQNMETEAADIGETAAIHSVDEATADNVTKIMAKPTKTAPVTFPSEQQSIEEVITTHDVDDQQSAKEVITTHGVDDQQSAKEVTKSHISSFYGKVSEKTAGVGNALKDIVGKNKSSDDVLIEEMMRRRKESYLQLHSLSGFPKKKWKLGAHRHLHARYAAIQRAGNVKLDVLLDKYNTYCSTKGFTKVEDEEFVNAMQSNYEIVYDQKTKMFQKLKWQMSSNKYDKIADPWPTFSTRICLLLIGMYFMTGSFVWFPLFYVAMQFRAHGMSVLFVAFRETVIVFPIFLLVVLILITVEASKQFNEEGTVFGVHELLWEPYKYLQMAGEGTHHPLITLGTIIAILCFCLGNLDLFLYYLWGGTQPNAKTDCFDKHDWVVLKKSKTRRNYWNIWFPILAKPLFKWVCSRCNSNPCRSKPSYPEQYAFVKVYYGAENQQNQQLTGIIINPEVETTQEESTDLRDDESHQLKEIVSRIANILELADKLREELKSLSNDYDGLNDDGRNKHDLKKIKECASELKNIMSKLNDDYINEQANDEYSALCQMFVPLCDTESYFQHWYSWLKVLKNLKRPKNEKLPEEVEQVVKKVNESVPTWKTKVWDVLFFKKCSKTKESYVAGELMSEHSKCFRGVEAKRCKHGIEIMCVDPELQRKYENILDPDATKKIKLLYGSTITMQINRDQWVKCDDHGLPTLTTQSDFNKFKKDYIANGIKLYKERGVQRKLVDMTALKDLDTAWKEFNKNKKEQIDKEHIYSVRKVNITRSGKIKNYELEKKTFNPFADDDGKKYWVPFKRLQRIQPPAVGQWVQTVTHALFLGTLNVVSSSVVAYIGMVASWWVLGAVIQPERTLAFATTVLVMVGAVKKMINDYQDLSKQLTGQIKKGVHDYVENIVSQTTDAISSQSTGGLVTVPTVFSGLNMTAMEIFKHLHAAEGTTKTGTQVYGITPLVEKIADELITKLTTGTSAIQAKEAGYLKNSIVCLSIQNSQEQLSHFKHFVAKLVQDKLVGEHNEEDGDSEESPIILLVELCLATDTFDARNCLEAAKPTLLKLAANSGSASEGFVKFGIWFLNVCADDMAIFSMHVRKLMVIFQLVISPDASNAPGLGNVKCTDLMLNMMNLFLSANMINVLLPHFLPSEEDFPSINLLNIDVLGSCDENFAKLVKALIESKGKQTVEVKRYQEQIFNILFDEVLAVANSGEPGVLKAAKDRFRPTVLQLLNISILLWNIIFLDKEEAVDTWKNVYDAASQLLSEMVNLLEEIEQKQGTSKTKKKLEILHKVLSLTHREESETKPPFYVACSSTVFKMICYQTLVRSKSSERSDSCMGFFDADVFKKYLKPVETHIDQLCSQNESGKDVQDCVEGVLKLKSLEKSSVNALKTKCIQKLTRVIGEVLETHLPQLYAFPLVRQCFEDMYGEGFSSKEQQQLSQGFELLQETLKLSSSKEKVIVALRKIVPQALGILFEAHPKKQQVLQVYGRGNQIVNAIEKMHAKRRAKEAKTKEKYRILFKSCDTSNDGFVDFEEFCVLVNGRVKLNLSSQKLKSLFSQADKTGSGTLYYKEFVFGMKLLEKEITYASLRKIGLTPATIFPAIAGVVIWLACILVFVLMGFTAFAEGTAFGAGIGAVLPMVAGKSAGLKKEIDKINVQDLIENVMKDDFQK